MIRSLLRAADRITRQELSSLLGVTETQVVDWFKNHRRERRPEPAAEMELAPTLLCPETPQSLRGWGAERCVCPPRLVLSCVEAEAESRANKAQAVLASPEWKQREQTYRIQPGYTGVDWGRVYMERDKEKLETPILRWKEAGERCRELRPGPWRAANVAAAVAGHHDQCECNCCETYGYNPTTRFTACRAALDDLIRRVEIKHGEHEVDDSSEAEGGSESDESDHDEAYESGFY